MKSTLYSAILFVAVISATALLSGGCTKNYTSTVTEPILSVSMPRSRA